MPLTLVPRTPRAGLPEPDESQAAALAAVAARPAVAVLGGPGSGTTTVALHAVVRAVQHEGLPPERVLVIAPTRLAAARLRQDLAAALDAPTGAPLVRTAHSAAMAVLASRAHAKGLPSPTLITGAEQDQILRDLLASHAAQGTGPAWSGIVPVESTLMPTFRAELRDLLMRAAEAGAGPDDLARLGAECERPEWVAAAEVYREYREVVAAQSAPVEVGDRLDPAETVRAAAAALESWEERLDGPRPTWGLVIVDDYQDATSATAALLRALMADAGSVVVTGSADQAVQGYRGGLPSSLADAMRPVAQGGLGAVRVELTGSHRQSGALAEVSNRIAERIGVSRDGSARASLRGAAGRRGDEAAVSALLAPHPHGQARAIARELRRSRHGFGTAAVSWGDMVVVGRSRALLSGIRAALVAADIPCESLGDAVALHEQAAVAPLLGIASLAGADAGDPWEPERVLALLSSRVVGGDPIALRRLGRRLVAADRASGGLSASGELLSQAVASPDGIPPDDADAAPVRRLHAAIAAARAALAGAAGPHQVLWTVWDALGNAPAWREAALGGSVRDDADLDAVMAIMKAAAVFEERMPRATTARFLEYVEGQDFAADSLARTGAHGDAVAFATPASAAGREWEVVIVAGVEEGAWPNLRLRDSTLGAGHLSDVLAPSGSPGPRDLPGRIEAARASRAAVADDEARQFLVAVSRARSRLVVTAVDDADSFPSRFLTWAATAAGVEARPTDRAHEVTDLRAAVARLRAEGARATGPARTAHATMLAHLALAGESGADPRDWHGAAAPSSTEPMWAEGQQVRVSPSKVETVETCALRWALDFAGGRREASEEQRMGSLVHEIAEEFPGGDLVAMQARLDERWPEVAPRPTLQSRRDYDRAVEMIRQFSQYVRMAGAQRVGVESTFSVESGRARLVGSADRVEVRDDGLHIVDIKTGKSAPTAQEAREHAQLEMYQLAAHAGAFDGIAPEAAEVRGAALLYLAVNKNPKVMHQPALDPEHARERLANAAELMADAGFAATVNDRCDSCPVARSCPARTTGLQVTDG